MFRVASLSLLAGLLASPVMAQQPASHDSSLSRAISGSTRTTPTPTRGSGRRVQVFSEAYTSISSGPYWVFLDSGVTYRVFVDQSDTSNTALTITPRNASLPPVRFSSSMLMGNNGVPFVAAATAQYRVEALYGGRDAIVVRIYREAADTYSSACVADPTLSGCRLAADTLSRPKKGVSPAVLIMVGFLPLLFAGMMRNGKSF